MTTTRFIRWFRDLTITDVGLVGGKNASLGEMFRELIPQGIRIPNGFAVTAEGWGYENCSDEGGNRDVERSDFCSCISR